VLFQLPSNRIGKSILRLACASLAIVAVTQFSAPEAAAQERTKSKQRAAEKTAKPAAITTQGPLTLLVSLNQQRMFVYDANGMVVQTRVSTGKPGHETPKGIYSIIEKKEFHESNIYLGAKMPHMQRLTMTGIALHGGVIPGYAASGGCVRLPFDFARRFFNVTDLNQRVVIAPDVQAPISFEHAALFSALPSAAQTAAPERRADGAGATALKVADVLLGSTSAHAATGPADRTIESAAEARRVERQALVDAIPLAAGTYTAAIDAEKSAKVALADARTAAKDARGVANKTAREASKAKGALEAQERKLKRIVASLSKNSSKMRADRLAELQAEEATERARIAPQTEEANRAAEAADAAANAAKVADAAADAAQDALKTAKAEVKTTANAEAAAKKAVAAFDRREATRSYPVSVFVSSATGMVHIRQGFERIIDAQVTIDNPSVPLDTFVYTALDWQDPSKTGLKWAATEVNEYSTRMSSLDAGDEPGRKKRKAAPQEVAAPPASDAEKAKRTLDRIKFPKEVSDLIAEVVKPGSTLIVSSYDMARSETRYAGTDFVVQMPEVVAKISKPTPRPPVQVVEDDSSSGGCFFFCGSSSSSSSSSKAAKRAKQRGNSSKSTVW
jgi:hypothetical protein